MHVQINGERNSMMTFDWLLHVLTIAVGGLFAAVLWVIAKQDFCL